MNRDHSPDTLLSRAGPMRLLMLYVSLSGYLYREAFKGRTYFMNGIKHELKTFWVLM